jgi:hypothetical protein
MSSSPAWNSLIRVAPAGTYRSSGTGESSTMYSPVPGRAIKKIANLS